MTGAIIPLRRSVTGPRARFEDLGEWLDYGTNGDQVQDGWLWLNDSRAGHSPLRHRVVARKRHRSGKVAWYATNVDAETLPASAVIDHYFARWPLQEHVFRAGNGRVGLNVHHGYGKQKVSNIAVLTALNQLEAKLGRCEQALEQAQQDEQVLIAEYEDWRNAEATLQETRQRLAEEMDRHIAAPTVDPEQLAACYAELSRTQRWIDEAREELLRVGEAVHKVKEDLRVLEARRARLLLTQEQKRARTTIYTVDTELDEIMTAYKLTFMNLAKRLMERHMETSMELDTLTQAVLTLPGERAITLTTETVRIYRQDRDPRAMEAVERACDSLNRLQLTRGPILSPRQVRFEIVDPSATKDERGSD